KYSFGRMPVEYYKKMQDYVYDSLDALVSECTRDKEYVYLVYFVPKRDEDKVDAVFASLYFEKIFIPDEYQGTPEQAANHLHETMKTYREEIFRLDMQIADYLQDQGKRIRGAADRLERYALNFDVRKYAACTKHDIHTFYIICGWMSERDAIRFRREIEQDEQVFCFVERDVSKLLNGPPTKLRHSAFLKPFEMFLEMYGLPSYNEIDPTPLLALTYMVFFGFMFGDFGQGAVLFLGGALLYRKKGLRLAGIISCCGIFSMLFGLLFGSVFGFEDIIEPLWLNPQKAMTNLPFIGSLNTVFVVAISIGMGIILLCMVLNILNGIKQRNGEKVLLDTNGAAGLVFYAAIVVCIVLFMTGHTVPGAAVLAVLLGVPLILLFFKEPIINKAEKKPELIEGSKGMFVTQGFFELFETLLSYFSNTLSFVRIGAFAVSHAAMMGVVLMLAGAESGGSISWPVIVLGNLFVCGMEGLIVGIQVLRLEYYELFSRFYTGGGRAFKPYGRNSGD
ncbi:MAG: V-type ATPase 116kDa subunit family protein, partial [Eubacteriales bacterium]|nr:V-type ATPase 116kDa subunit family protein [Eubacteriales bacterium]